MAKRGSQVGKWANVWTPEEDAIIQVIWSSGKKPKHMAYLLPNRTPDAQSSRAQRLGYAQMYKDAPKVSERHSPLKSAILSNLKRSGKMTGRQLSELTGNTAEGCQEGAHSLHKQGLIHIDHWVRSRPNGLWVEVWAEGDGPDAQRPKPRDRTLRDKRSKLLRRVERGTFSPFGLIVEQIAEAA